MKSLFNREFIKTGIITKEQEEVYSTIFAKRFEADYEDFFEIDLQQANEHLAKAKQFVRTIEEIINRTDND